MKLKDLFALSLNSITHRKLRSWLTLLGIVIGVAAVISIVSIGQSAQTSINDQLSSFGADVITLTAGYSRAEGFGGFARESPSTSQLGAQRATASTSITETPKLTNKDILTLKANPNIISVNEIVSGRGDVVFLSEKGSATITGVNPNTWKDTISVTLSSGRLLSASDTTGVVIGSGIASGMFKQSINLGRTITIEDKPFTVVGILATSGSSFGGGADRTIYMTTNAAYTVLSEDINKGEYSSIQAKVNDPELVDSVIAELTPAFYISRKVTEKTKDFTLTSSQAVKEQISSITSSLTLFLGAIAAISLIVGAIGVANSMFTSVMEKTKDIGILKALGSTNQEILLLFVIEAGLFGLIGGIIGVIIGTVASHGISGMGIIPMLGSRGGTTIILDPLLIIIGIVMSTLVGIIAGVIPARGASKMKPVDALRYE